MRKMGRKGADLELKDFFLGTALILVSLVLLSSLPVEGRPKEATDGDKSKASNPAPSTAPPPTSTAARVTDPPMPTEARRERDEELDDDDDDREMAIPLCTRFTGTITPTTPTTVETTTLATTPAAPAAAAPAPAPAPAVGPGPAVAPGANPGNPAVAVVADLGANEGNGRGSVRQKIDDYQEELLNMMEELRAVPQPPVPASGAARDPTGGAVMPLIPAVDNPVVDSVRLPKGRRPKLGRHRHPYNQPNRYRNKAHPYETSVQRRKWSFPPVDDPAGVGAPVVPPVAPGMGARPSYGYRRGGGGMRAKGYQASNHRARSGVAGRPGGMRSRQHMTRQGGAGGLGAQVMSQYETNLHKPRASLGGMVQRSRPMGRGLPPPDLDGLSGMADAMPMID